LPEVEPATSRDQAAKAANAKGRTVQDAAMVKREAPDLYEDVRSGKITVAKGVRETERRSAKKNLTNVSARKAKAVEPPPASRTSQPPERPTTPRPGQTHEHTRHPPTSRQGATGTRWWRFETDAGQEACREGPRTA
jgi:hypothetical protein